MKRPVIFGMTAYDVVGVTEDGCLLVRGEDGVDLDSDMTPDEFGWANLTDVELEMIAEESARVIASR